MRPLENRLRQHLWNNSGRWSQLLHPRPFRAHGNRRTHRGRHHHRQRCWLTADNRFVRHRPIGETPRPDAQPGQPNEDSAIGGLTGSCYSMLNFI